MNAHFQKGVADKAVRDTQDLVHRMLLNVIKRWPDAVHLALWPYAMSMAVQIQNSMPDATYELYRLEYFARISIHSKPEHYYTF